ENIARYLGVTLDEIGPLSKGAAAPEKISGICAVLAETDVINMVSRGITVANILKGIHESMAGRLVKLLRSVGAEGTVLVTGGLSADTGLLQAMTDALAGGKASRGPGRKALHAEGDPEPRSLNGLEIRTHPDAVYAGALGAALWGAYRFERLRERRAA
ncbi:MAG: hypothetical protein IT372_21040, partial [Polyangiaceae bacterium]|nr:hypothetical protein [Polyangiaceae bacterium]